MIKIPDKKAQTVCDALIEFFQNIPPHIRKTITYDNGRENVLHEVVNTKCNMNSYFCDPYSAWQKGLVENTIGKLRQFFPKKTNFNTISEYDIMKVEDIINNRPWKTLEFRMPAKLFTVALCP